MPYSVKFEKPIKEIIESRISCRTYQERPLEKPDKTRLLAFCGSIRQGLAGENVTFRLVEHKTENLKAMKLAYYGLFKNAHTFLVGIIDRSDIAYVSYGYAFEHVVLKATEMGLGTCWLGDFDPALIHEIVIHDHQIIPALCVVGYPAVRSTLKEKVARFTIRASRRKNWERLFYDGSFTEPLTKKAAGMYARPLEYVRLAPSSRNTQPWRVVKQDNPVRFHFFKQTVRSYCDEKHFHEIDLGIAMSHFELGCAEKNINGVWKTCAHSLGDIPAKVSYIMSWHEMQ